MTTAVDHAKLESFMGQVLTDLGATIHAALVVIGERAGIYRAMDGAGPLTSEEVAERAGASERYVREWLRAQAAGGYLTYHAADDRYELPPEQAFALAAEDGLSVPGAFQLALATTRNLEALTERFRTGEGFGWHEHHADLFDGTERFFRPGYAAHLVAEWLPALEGVEEKLRAGARVADVGCGHGSSTILMAEAFPASTFVGFDYHEPSIARARAAAAEAGVADRVEFVTASSTAFPGSGYDLVAMFDCLHDMGDPTGAAAHVRRSLAPDGTFMIVEPFANDRVEENMNPVGRLYYSASTLVCTPASLSQEGRAALGAQAGEARLRQALLDGGFARVRRAAETPVNMVLEARP
jgi:SAM-dependent methyltransferase